jgi:hypothetical protein
MITKKAQAQADKELARMELREMFAEQEKPKVYTILRHCSQSGMSRDISLKTIENGRLIDITYTASIALGEKPKDRNGQRVIRVNGCGMDMGYHLVHNLSMALYFGQDQAGYVLSHDWA